MYFSFSEFVGALLIGAIALAFALVFFFMLAACIGAISEAILSSHDDYLTANATVEAKEIIRLGGNAGTGALYRLAYRHDGRDYRCQSIRFNERGASLSPGRPATVYISSRDPWHCELDPPSRPVLMLLLVSAAILWVCGMSGGLLLSEIENWFLWFIVLDVLVLALCGTRLRTMCAVPILKLFYSPDQAVIRDYHIYNTSPENAIGFSSDIPVLILTLEGTLQGRPYRLDCPPVTTENLMRSLGLPEQTPSFWYEKHEWDQLLLGTSISVRLAPDLDEVMLSEIYHVNRTAVFSGILAVLLIIGSMLIGMQVM